MTDRSCFLFACLGRERVPFPPIETPCRIPLLLTQVLCPMCTHPSHFSDLLIIFFQMKSTNQVKNPLCATMISIHDTLLVPCNNYHLAGKHSLAHSALRQFLDQTFTNWFSPCGPSHSNNHVWSHLDSYFRSRLITSIYLHSQPYKRGTYPVFIPIQKTTLLLAT